MQLILCQKFPLGRFHATIWKAFPYDDPYGEWPPSPWRLLRAIVARSYQLERERSSVTREDREGLVAAFSRSSISWRLPDFTWRGPGLRQYQPAEFGLDNPPVKKLKLIPLDSPQVKIFGGRFAVLAKAGETRMIEVFDEQLHSIRRFATEDELLIKSLNQAKRAATHRESLINLKRYPPRSRCYSTTKVQDNFWLTSGPGESEDASSALWWYLSGDAWTPAKRDLLEQCLARMTYFGRAESITEISVVRDARADSLLPNCHLYPRRSAGMVPVLAPQVGVTLQQIEATTDDPSLAGSTIPPGAVWLFAERPHKPIRAQKPKPVPELKPIQLVQFAIGSRTAPAMRDVVRLTQRFRGRVLSKFLQLASQRTAKDWLDAAPELRSRAALLAGKDAAGVPLSGHRHAVFFIHAEHGRPVRLCVWRRDPFDTLEQTAILSAAGEPLPLDFKSNSWALTLVPLDSLVPPPPALTAASYRNWETLTPFVPPRHVFNRQGKAKVECSVEVQVRRELANRGIEAENVEVTAGGAVWVKIHHVKRGNGGQSNAEKLGYSVRLRFASPVLGHCSLGFRPISVSACSYRRQTSIAFRRTASPDRSINAVPTNNFDPRLFVHFASRLYGIMSSERSRGMATSPNLDEYIGVHPQSDFDLAEMIEKGLPTGSVTRLREKGLSFSEISEIVIAPRTLKHRNARGEQLSREETDRIVRVARILALAEQIFGDRGKAFGWLRLPDERLHGRTPLSMLRTESGGRFIEDLLWQIDEGVVA